MSADEFRALGHELVEHIAAFYESLGERPVTRASSPQELRAALGDDGLPEDGMDASKLLAEITPLLFEHSLHNSHPRFMGYITSSSSPLGVLADMLASSVNANIAKWDISPLASEIETQVVQWVADFIGYDHKASGLMVSGGNMANFVGFVAARKKIVPWDIRKEGNYADDRRLTAYVSTETHTWVQKAADVCGMGADGIRWIETDDDGRMRVDALREQVASDRADGCFPFLVVGTGGSVSFGIVDPIRELSSICEEEGLWLHVDGAYGAPATCLADAPDDLHALSLADSVAIDPHKWLYCPIEVACVLTKHKNALVDAFSFNPSYYQVESGDSGINYYELGMQNTRGFRALKVWLQLKAIGRAAYRESIGDDVRLAQRLYALVDSYDEFEANSNNLSITTFRYVPAGKENDDEYLNDLNREILGEILAEGRFFITNAILDGRYYLRACVVNFRTSEKDVDALPEAVAAVGRRLASK